MTVTDEMVERALAVNSDQVQGFFHRDRTEQHVIRDFTDHAGGAEIWSGTSHEDMMYRIEFIRMQRALTAALSDQVVVPREPTRAMVDAAMKASGELYEKMVKAAHPYEPVFLHVDIARMMVEYRAMIAAAPPPASTAGEVG